MSERETIAFALAPLPLVILLLLSIIFNTVAGNTGDGGYAGAFVAIVIFSLISYVVTLLMGMPIHLILRRLRKTGLIYYLGLAVLPFIIFAGVVAVWIQLEPTVTAGLHTNPHSLYMNREVAMKWTLILAAIALLPATTFWYAGVRQPKP